MRDERVSVVVPVHNGARHLEAALESILAQESGALQVIVVDDGSTDATAGILNRFSDRVHPVRQDNLGPGAARNSGIARATAPLIAFLDADDVWPPAGLTHQLDALAGSPGAAVAWGLSSRVVAADAPPPRDDWHGRPQWALSVGSMLFRRRVFVEAGVFDPGLPLGEDLDLMIRITERRIPVIRHPRVVCERGLHAGNMTRDGAAADRARFVAIGKAFERRRANAERTKMQGT